MSPEGACTSNPSVTIINRIGLLLRRNALALSHQVTLEFAWLQVLSPNERRIQTLNAKAPGGWLLNCLVFGQRHRLSGCPKELLVRDKSTHTQRCSTSTTPPSSGVCCSGVLRGSVGVGGFCPAVSGAWLALSHSWGLASPARRFKA